MTFRYLEDLHIPTPPERTRYIRVRECVPAYVRVTQEWLVVSPHLPRSSSFQAALVPSPFSRSSSSFSFSPPPHHHSPLLLHLLCAVSRLTDEQRRFVPDPKGTFAQNIYIFHRSKILSQENFVSSLTAVFVNFISSSLNISESAPDLLDALVSISTSTWENAVVSIKFCQ